MLRGTWCIGRRGICHRGVEMMCEEVGSNCAGKKDGEIEASVRASGDRSPRGDGGCGVW